MRADLKVGATYLALAFSPARADATYGALTGNKQYADTEKN
jgi:hypothetical protein